MGKTFRGVFMENLELTNMVMIVNEKDNKVLVQNRVKGSWTGIAFPGGHVEKGESIIDSAIREVKEETGLDINNLEICGIKDWYIDEKNKRYMVVLLKTSFYSGTLIEDGEEGDVFWVNYDEIHSLNLADGFDKMIDIMFNKSINEYFIFKDKNTLEWKEILK